MVTCKIAAYRFSSASSVAARVVPLPHATSEKTRLLAGIVAEEDGASSGDGILGGAIVRCLCCASEEHRPDAILELMHLPNKLAYHSSSVLGFHALRDIIYAAPV